jgi:hypothetical protein
MLLAAKAHLMEREMFMTLFAKIGRAVSTFRGPVHEAMQREDVKAAAHYWRQRFAQGSFTGIQRGDRTITTLARQFSERELDSFERKMAAQFAREVVYAPDGLLFREDGADVSNILIRVLITLDLIDAVDYFGACFMRFLLNKEVACVDRSLPKNWVPIWSNPNFADAALAH